MPTTQRAYDWVLTRLRGDAEPAAPGSGRTIAAHREVDALHAEIEALVTRSREPQPRAALDAALEAVSKLQVVHANLDACNPPSRRDLQRALLALADERLHRSRDAIERGLAYTSDNTLRLLTQH
jgi:hypothetical protein